jgi:hypothetical protein
MMKAPRLFIVLAALIALAAPVTAVAAFLGPDDPLGSPQNPLSAPPMDPATVAAATQKGHLNEARAPQLEPDEAQQAEHPCKLVTAAEASGLFGAQVGDPIEAPLGPSCIFRSGQREDFVSVALQRMEEKHLAPLIRDRDKLDVDRLTGYCGPGEASNLLVPLSSGRVLTIEGGAGGCELAKAFALKALGRLSRR